MTGGRHRDADHYDRLLDETDLRLDAEGLAVNRETLRQMALFRRMVRREFHKLGEIPVADLTRLQSALDALGVDVTDVSAKIDDLKAQIAALSVGQITQDQIDALADAAEAVDASLDASTADAPAEPPVEPPTELA